MQQTFQHLEHQRSQLYQELADTGDFRRGSIQATFRKCGKDACACAEPGHPGHGPRHLLTRSVKGKTEATQLRPGPELEKAHREVANHKRFKGIVEQIVEVNEEICDARPHPDELEAEAAGGGQKKGSTRLSRPSSRRR